MVMQTVKTAIVVRSSPVSLPDVQRLLVHVVVSQRLFVQEVKEVFDGRRDDGARTQHAAEEVVHELLQSALKKITSRNI